MNTLLFALVVLLLIGFTLTNGFMVGGSLASTVITTRTLEPLTALICVALCEIGGVFLFGQAVVRFIGQQLIVLPASSGSLMGVLAAALVGALGSTLVMWKLALPASTSHAQIGGLIGAFSGGYGLGSVHWDMFGHLFVLLGLLPLIGFVVGYGLSFAADRIGEYATPALAKPVRAVQILSLIGAALTHGSNDAQKALVMFAMAMTARQGMGMESLGPIPGLLCGVTLAVGLFFGSRRIIQTLGSKLYRLQPLEGACAQTSTMALMGICSVAGYPMSTSQILSTSILGAGAAVHPRSVRWALAVDIGLGWLVTLPAAALVSGALAYGVRTFYVVP